eukprot:TRINITY_DN11617_c0_g1_i2.p1 TRINITY_DN11617_c0_g1~~TRINITY_DN11617_c0_g1_i2.p1  ORF type:complete len:475 (-),score=74.71 TRINITY_DN11617_c0_g1_i2:55-1440(-)
MAVVEVMRGKLLWAPEKCTLPTYTFLVQHVPFKDLCDGDLTYSVPHYSSQSFGRAFGPLGLDKTFKFCCELDKQIRDAPGAIAVIIPFQNPEDTCNAAVLFGAYLIFRHAWTPAQVEASLGAKHAKQRFACSWACLDRPEEERVLKVRDCWEGLTIAKELCWIDCLAITDDVLCSLFCDSCQHMVNYYDSTWIVPGHIMVCADPVTTMCDPSPSSLKEIFGTQRDQLDSLSETSLKSASGATCSEDLAVSEKTISWSGCPAGRVSKSDKVDLESSADSTETVCKDFASIVFPPPQTVSSSRGLPFTTFLTINGVGLVVRTNYSNEKGMPSSSYDEDTLRSYGFKHQDIPILDKCGGLPTRDDIAEALRIAKEHSVTEHGRDNAAVLVHCKGGFGRSVVIACCLAIDRFDIPGSALLGWVRIVRPGAINTVKQERFLSSFRGTEDLRRFCNNSKSPSCCSVS